MEKADPLRYVVQHRKEHICLNRDSVIVKNVVKRPENGMVRRLGVAVDHNELKDSPVLHIF